MDRLQYILVYTFFIEIVNNLDLPHVLKLNHLNYIVNTNRKIPIFEDKW